MKNIKVGVIGVGYLGRFHAQKYAALEGRHLVGVADIDVQQGSRLRRVRLPSIYRLHELLPQVDAVSIVVPTSNHCQVAGECLDAGIDVLLEKPMTVTLEEADELIARLRARKLILQIGHLERFNPAVQAMEPFLTTPFLSKATGLPPSKTGEWMSMWFWI